MGAVLEVFAHRTGPWLVKAGNLQYAVPPRLGRALKPLAGRIPAGGELRTCIENYSAGPVADGRALETDRWIRELSQALTPADGGGKRSGRGRRAGRPIRLRVPLVPAWLVRRLAGGVRVLAGDRGLACLAVLGAAGYLSAQVSAFGPGAGKAGFSWGSGSIAAGLGLFLVTAIWHEMGHAAALARSGYPPGGIGAGVLFVIPVLFADVTAVGALPKAGRVRVDISGVIFQLAAGGVFVALAGWLPVSPFWAGTLVMAGSSVLLAVSWSLFPFIRSDGYWLLCDLLGLDDLDRPPSRSVSRVLRVFLVVYQLANAVFLLLIGVYFPWRMIGLLFGLVHRLGFRLDAELVKWLGPVVGVAFLGMMGIGIIRRVVVLVRSARLVAGGGQEKL